MIYVMAVNMGLSKKFLRTEAKPKNESDLNHNASNTKNNPLIKLIKIYKKPIGFTFSKELNSVTNNAIFPRKNNVQ